MDFVHGVPLLFGGTNNTAAVRTTTEIDKWVRNTAKVEHNISVTRTLWGKLIHTSRHSANCNIRLPFSQDALELDREREGSWPT
jgi:hypothetical protein